MNTIDAYHGTRMLIENAFSHLTWHADACAQLGFKGISQVWKEEPAWYFWVEHVPGAFLLRLHAEEPVGNSQYVNLALHYYPAEDSPESLSLNEEELKLRSDGAIFDQPTGTPQYETFETCLPHFLAAEIGLMIGPDNQLQLLVFSSGENRAHPVYDFLNLLVCTLNFEAKTHHLVARQLSGDQARSLFLAYDRDTFDAFLKTFALDPSLLEEPTIADMLDAWKHSAHMDASCSMSGACSCH